MKKTVILSVAVLALAGIGASAGGATGNRDVVAGGGSSTLNDPSMGLNEHDQFSVGATSAPDGSDPQGAVTAHIDDLAGTTSGDWHGDVSEGCVIVSGNTAVAVGKLPESQQFEVPGHGVVDYLAVTVVDNGNPQGGEPADQASVILLFDTTAQQVCAGLRTLPTVPLDHGNFTVQDAS